MNSSSLPLNLTGILIALAIVALFGGVVFWVTRLDKKKKEAEKQVLLSLGFTQVEQPGADIVERLIAINRHSPRQSFTLLSLYERRVEGGTYLIYDLFENSGNQKSFRHGSNAIAVIAPEMNLPRVSLVSRVSYGQQSAPWMVNAVEKVMDFAMNLSHLNRLSFAESPDIDSKLIVMAEDEIDARAFFTEERLRQFIWLAEPGRLSGIDCCGDLFILKRLPTQAQPGLETSLPDLLRDARRIWTALV